MVAKRFDLLSHTRLESRDGTVQQGGLLRNCFTEMKPVPYLFPRPGLGTGAIYAIGTGPTGTLTNGTVGTTTLGYYGSAGLGLFYAPSTPIDVPSGDASGGGPAGYGGALYAAALSSGKGAIYQVNHPNLPGTNNNWQRWDGSVVGGAPVLGVTDGPLSACMANYAPISWGPPTMALRLCVNNQGGKYWLSGPTPTPTGTQIASVLRSITDQPYTVTKGQYVGTSDTQIPQLIGLGGAVRRGVEKVYSATASSGTFMIKMGRSAYTSTPQNNGAGSFTQITSNYPALTVPGVVYLNGTFYVMEPDGTIWNSTAGADDPTTWGASDFITAEFDSDSGVALSKALNYVVAFGQWTVELFWDAGNPTGSPLSPVTNGVLLIGCAAGASVVQTESTLIWIAQRKGQGSSAHKGRFIAILVGTSYEVLSDDDVSRILDADDLATVYACVVELGGHTWYVLTLGTSAITLAYDMQEKRWAVWSRLSPAAGVAVSSLRLVNGVATGITSGAHGRGDGDPVVISGATPSGWNGTYNVNVTGTTSFTFPLAGTLGTATTGTAAGWGTSPLGLVASVGFNNQQLVQDTAGNIFNMATENRVDNGSPMDVRIRTEVMDFENDLTKFCHNVKLVADVLTSQDYGLLRTSDDDYASWTYFRRFDLSAIPSRLHRLGDFRRRAWEYRYTGTAVHRVEALEPDLTQGVT